MSLFPAYTGTSSNQEITEDTKTSEWLENNSFQVRKNVTTEAMSESSSQTSSSSSDSEIESEVEKTKTKSKKPKKKKKRKHKEVPKEEPKALEFNGDEDYYIDKKPVISYRTIKTLHRPACPRYHRSIKGTIDMDGSYLFYKGNNVTKSIKRYYRELKPLKNQEIETPRQALDENEYTLRLGQLNRKVLEAPNDLQNWLDLINLQNQNPYKWSRLLLAEKKIDIIKRAMVYHTRNDSLYRLFIETIIDTYPSFEVSKMLDGLLNKDAYSYTLWTAQIMTTQGSMARCIVPDVLRIYERSMQKMHHSQKQSQTNTSTIGQLNTDMIMLRLFNNCALFLRQAGLYEQFFALVKLALELNVSISHFNGYSPSDEDQRTLIEYEELILQSGLPMNEIWLRIEKLRQCFNFWPCPSNSQMNSDPQRVVFNEDVCHYIYPLKRPDNSFHLMLLILRLVKLPFVQCDSLAAKFSTRVDAIGDSDAVEEALAVGIRKNYASQHIKQQDEFFNSLHELAKEMCVTPTFLSSSIGHEIYTKCISELLMNASSAYEGIDESRRVIFLLLLFQFERLCLVVEKSSKKITPQFVKSGRSRFKAILKQRLNRDALLLYNELALYEFEALERDSSLDSIKGTFESIIENISDASEGDLLHTYVCYAEILLSRGMNDEALLCLVSYVLKVDIKQKNSISEAKKLSALQQICEKLDNKIAVEKNVEIMILEQYLLPDHTISLLKLRSLLQYLIGQKLESLTYLDKLLNIFRDTCDRHRFLRENIYALYITIAQLPNNKCLVSNATICSKLFEALKEYPRNLYFLQTCGMMMISWYRIRIAMLGPEPNILSLTFLIASARFRFLAAAANNNLGLEEILPTITITDCDQKYNESIVRNRILNIFQFLTSSDSSGNASVVAHKTLRRNALFWRFYLRCLSDQSTAFETSKKCLLTALDDCPWSKALYMDGATYVPQELVHLQDLMIEKQLRLYALPEELEILRER